MFHLRILLACGLAFALAGCSEPAARSGAAGPGADAPIGVVTAAVTKRPLALEIEAIGTALANESVEITSKSSNLVAAIRFEEGQRVRRGAVLVELDSAEVRAELAEAEAALVESRSQFDRSRTLAVTQALSAAQLDQIEATLKANEARVAAARARLADTVIRAPFDGSTGFRRVSPGGLVSPGAVITTLDDISVIKLEFTVPQTYFSALEQGLPVLARTTALPDREFEGRIAAIGSRIDPVSRAVAVRAELPNDKGLLRPGMFMTVRLHAAATPALVAPEQALVPEQGRVFVFAVEDGKAHRREVTIGRRRPGEVQIVSGLAEGARVVVEGTQKVRDGSSVQELAASAARGPESASARAD